MKIESRAKLIPFSKVLGACVLVPKTRWCVEVFPAVLIFTDLVDGTVEEVDVPVKGPMERFRVSCDLEKGRVEVEGIGANGFFRYWIEPEKLRFQKGKTRRLSFLKEEEVSLQEHLFMGVHKKSQWERVMERGDFTEIFPFWFALAQWMPKVKVPKASVGTMQLLSMETMRALLQTGFEGILVPRLDDATHSGILPVASIPKTVSPLVILQEGAKLIRSLFFEETQDGVALLPHLPKEFHAGKMVRIQSKWGRFDLEWSKKLIKKVIIHPKGEGMVRIQLKRGLKGFRLNGKSHNASDPVELHAGKKLYLDRFS